MKLISNTVQYLHQIALYLANSKGRQYNSKAMKVSYLWCLCFLSETLLFYEDNVLFNHNA